MTAIVTTKTERRETSEWAHDSASGMRETARDLRAGAGQMFDSNDRDMMLRLAANHDRRADDVERRIDGWRKSSARKS